MVERARAPRRIGGIEVPHDDVSEAAWREATRLPAYLLHHSVRSYCWGVAIAGAEGWSFDRRILWVAALLHDRGLTRIGRDRDCFEVAGGAFARRFLERAGLPAGDAERVDRAIVLHMQPGVTLADGVEAVLLDRATAVDVRGAEFGLIDGVRGGRHRGPSARAVRSALPGGDPARGGPPPGVSERAPPPRDRARGLDGPLAWASDGAPDRR
jgi:hypothetical protein